jgi:alpha-L-rhamnosidase
MKNGFRLFCLVFFALSGLSLKSQDVKWDAHWITHPTVQPQTHAVILFRKSFELPVKPEKFVVHVSADNHYRLFVNGKYILRGPARGDISHWFFETIDLAEYLQAGKNTIAAEVVNWGPKRSFTYFSQMTSFIMQGNSKAEEVVNTWDGTWKCLHNQAYSMKNVEWMTDRTTIDFGLYVCNPTDSIQAELYPWGWEQTDYMDANWLPAKWCNDAGSRDNTFAGGVLYSGGKLLIPRRTGILEENKVQFVSIRKVTGIQKNENFIHGFGGLIIPATHRPNLRNYGLP